ncbi:MAG: PqqD family peptide modification chaperone [Candidatus Aenigmatarchaeota archaeon]
MEGKPVKAKNLKIIDYLGTLYATFNGSSMWKIDKVAFGILRMCDGKRTVEDIVDELAKRISHRPEDVKPVVEEILNELTKMKFVEWV